MKTMRNFVRKKNAIISKNFLKISANKKFSANKKCFAKNSKFSRNNFPNSLESSNNRITVKMFTGLCYQRRSRGGGGGEG